MVNVIKPKSKGNTRFHNSQNFKVNKKILDQIAAAATFFVIFLLVN